jgi:hypothetical protein
MQQMETQSQRGVRQFGAGIGALAVVSLLFLGVAYYLLLLSPDLMNLQNNTTQSVDPQTASKLLPLLPPLCGLIIVLIIALIELLLGFLSIYRGSEEYGEQHARDINRATLFLVLVIVMIVVGVAASVAQSAPGGVVGVFSVFSILSTVADVLRAAFVGLLLFYLVKAFLPEGSLDKVYLAIGLYVAGPVASYLASITYAPPAAYYEPFSNIPFDPAWIIPSAIGAVMGFIALIIFFFLYRQAYQRFRRDEIRPIWRQPGFSPAAQAPPEQRWQPPPGG